MHNIITEFIPPPQQCTIDKETVHVWRACFPPKNASVRQYASYLSGGEIERARRFIRQSDRERYIYSHGVLRSILGSYINYKPQQLIFESDDYTKPFLAGPGNYQNIQFNLSHSGDLTLIALTREKAVGIDVEQIRNIPEMHEIIRGTFSADEREYLNTLSPENIEEGFFACWTAKEAIVKGMGGGLSYPLDNFTIIFSSGVPTDVKFTKCDSVRDKYWKVMGLSPRQGYLGALAVTELTVEPIFYDYC